MRRVEAHMRRFEQLYAKGQLEEALRADSENRSRSAAQNLAPQQADLPPQPQQAPRQPYQAQQQERQPDSPSAGQPAYPGYPPYNNYQ